MRNLWFDIGNTRLKYWITENNTITAHFAELHLQSPADLILGLIQYLKSQNIDQIGLSSVLDASTNQRIHQSLTALQCPITFAHVQKNYAGLTCGYQDHKQLGIDRWLQMLAVAKPQQKICVVGCGTALTIDLIDNMQHIGGYILPNLYLQRDALIQNTKGIKIPDRAFSKLSPGTNTLDCVHHGILLGLVSIIEKIVQQSPQHLVLTGGDAHLFAQHLQPYHPRVEPDLLLHGLEHYTFTL